MFGNASINMWFARSVRVCEFKKRALGSGSGCILKESSGLLLKRQKEKGEIARDSLFPNICDGNLSLTIVCIMVKLFCLGLHIYDFLHLLLW